MQQHAGQYSGLINIDCMILTQRTKTLFTTNKQMLVGYETLFHVCLHGV